LVAFSSPDEISDTTGCMPFRALNIEISRPVMRRLDDLGLEMVGADALAHQRHRLPVQIAGHAESHVPAGEPEAIQWPLMVWDAERPFDDATASSSGCITADTLGMRRNGSPSTVSPLHSTFGLNGPRISTRPEEPEQVTGIHPRGRA
jgi:hypothetical protein